MPRNEPVTDTPVSSANDGQTQKAEDPKKGESTAVNVKYHGFCIGITFLSSRRPRVMKAIRSMKSSRN